MGTDFDWALHPGGSLIITGVQKAMDLPPELLRASYEIYINYGNSSSATIISVMNRLREVGPGKEHVIACAFGPGIALEMMVLRRRNFDSAQIKAETPIENVAANGHHEVATDVQQNGVMNGIELECSTNGHNSLAKSTTNSTSTPMLKDRAETNHRLPDRYVPAANGALNEPIKKPKTGIPNGVSSAASNGSESLVEGNLLVEDLD